MNFVWIHAVFSTIWMVYLEQNPWPTLDAGGVARGNLLVDLRPDRQNRQASFQQANPDHDFHAQEIELRTNTELTRQIHLLTTELQILGQSAPDDHTPRAGEIGRSGHKTRGRRRLGITGCAALRASRGNGIPR